MASHHHLHHHPAAAVAAACCSCCYVAYTPCYHHPDHHYHLNPPPPPPQPHIYSAQAHVRNLYQPHHPPPPPSQPHLYSAQAHVPNIHHSHLQERFFQEEREPHPTIASLLHRIAALELAFDRRFSSTQSLRDAAARTIQTHFRAFLARRSRTLRQLKDLASIKSSLRILKLSVSDNVHVDYDGIYHAAVGLLLKLDTIQGGDPMIRDGKSSIRRELNALLVSIDGICVERSGASNGVKPRSNLKSRVANSERTVRNGRCGDLKRVNVDRLRGLVERIDKLTEDLDEEESEVIESSNVSVRKHGVSGNRTGVLVKQHGVVRPKMDKSVSFVENGKIYRVLRRNHEPFLDEDRDNSTDKDNVVGAEGELEDDSCREVNEVGVSLKEGEDVNDSEAHSETGGSLPSSDGEKDSRSYLRGEGNCGRTRHDLLETDDFAFSAPLPLKMETRADLIDMRKKLANV